MKRIIDGIFNMFLLALLAILLYLSVSSLSNLGTGEITTRNISSYEELKDLCEFTNSQYYIEREKEYKLPHRDIRSYLELCTIEEASVKYHVKNQLTIDFKVNLCTSDVKIHGDTVEIFGPIQYEFNYAYDIVNREAGSCYRDNSSEYLILDYIKEDGERWVNEYMSNREYIITAFIKTIPFDDYTFIIRGEVKDLNVRAKNT